MSVTWADLQVGASIGERTVEITRADLVRYAGASGDFNPIHWNEDVATSVELPGVIAHGMFTMGAAVQLVVDWIGNPAAVVDYRARFTKPVPVANTDGGPGAVLQISGTIGALDEDNQVARVDLTVGLDGTRVLARSQAQVRIW
ncbi:MaoC/PaaZ C-terminal domain-containing protein [Tersicoccus sp. Bi-70]|uniref:MaoC/PaaZ C-terminal domain-containing protein n=1 Tax=Tersicoccus sp. Bi-70 TaxID=1897634 RepID=UPI00097884C1|nr:MaoC/PaaZ C-terminal domain-containing protein [Tersicoccus sp. Bi-70]OMH34901.1 acyl dehydratase [Tersicoccus sp. Bi-70]